MKPVAETPTKLIDYATLSAGYGALFGAVLLGARDREQPVGQEEIPALALATFALAKLVAKEKVESWVREPFVEQTSEGARPKGRRLRYAVGELLTCTRCLGAWSSLGLVGLRVMRPREARVVTTVLATSALNDFLQTGFSLACVKVSARQDGERPDPSRTSTLTAPGG